MPLPVSIGTLLPFGLRITFAELEQVLADNDLLKEVPDCESARFYFDQMDANGDGEVTFDEFMAMLHPKGADRARMPKTMSLSQIADRAML